MADKEIRYAKTAKGIELLEKRSDQLPRKVRSALLLVFASKTDGELREQGEAIGAPPDFLERLLEAGLIERLGGGGEPSAAVPVAARMPGTPAERFIAATRLMEQSVASEAGLKAFFFQLKLQKCGNVDDVVALLPVYREFMEKHAGAVTAELYTRELRQVLGQPPA
jgi:hypothetical protein